MSNLIIFDLDGVITSEEAYWSTAGLTLHELLYSPRYWNLDASQLGADGQYRPANTAAESKQLSRSIFPESEILALKARAINSNWDTCYAAVCLCLIDVLRWVIGHNTSGPDTPLFPLRPWDADWNADLREQIARAEGQIRGQGDREGVGKAAPLSWHSIHDLLDQFFASQISQGCVGLELINRFDAYASQTAWESQGGEGSGGAMRDVVRPLVGLMGDASEGVFSRYSPFWTFCQDIFQEWYLGDDLYKQTYGHAPKQAGKPGCIHFEQPLLPPEEIRATLETLHQQGYILGFATGRVRQEAVYPLKMYGLLPYFADQHISTYDDVEHAESEMRTVGDQTLLSKPHPFQFLIAADRNSALNTVGTRSISPQDFAKSIPPSNCKIFIVVGDSTSDILGGRAAGAITIAVLTGARTPEARTLLAQSNPDFTIDDITKLPAMLAHIDSLATIQSLQFTDREKAERLLQRWFARYMHLTTESVTLTPKAVSLNSFNGLYRSVGEEYFFKTHVEEQGVLEEYYHAELLHQAGYTIVRPLRTLHEEGRQMVIYPVVRWPVLFDLMRAVETGDRETAGDVTVETLAAVEQEECGRLLNIYRSTLALSTAEEHARAPIHQLFWHRLAGERFKSFYLGKSVPLPNKSGQEVGIVFDQLLKYHWVINGVPQQHTLGELLERAKIVLHPAGSSCQDRGEGGDVGLGGPLRSPWSADPSSMLRRGRFIAPTADLSAHMTPLINRLSTDESALYNCVPTVIGHGDAHFGNVFLEGGKSYLYFDPAFAGRHSPLLDVIKPLFHNVFATWMYFPKEIVRDLHLSVSFHDMTVSVEHNYTLTPVRQAILQAKRTYLLKQLVAELYVQDALPADWRELMHLALMCCPLLTINLLDKAHFPVPISWLGLAQAVQLGNNGIEAWSTE